ncbi:MAG: chromosomal replication initiator protein DnaA [Chloroflexi bacterium]|nr:chromosomal replication initiator protein DnaA [Chloroflexota bacterium]
MKELSAREVWRAALGVLQLQLDKPTFETWLKQTEGVNFDNSHFVVEVPTPFAIAWLERRMYQNIQKTVEKVTGHVLDIQFQVRSGEPALAEAGPSVDSLDSPLPEGETEDSPQANGNHAPMPDARPANGYAATQFAFNPKYTFESYVVGPSNRLAYSAARAVVDAPGRAYNPLFLYSGVGLGKTHLLYAIGQTCVSKGLSVLYVSSEQFTNEFISAIRNRTTEEFRSRYRSVEVLLIDDVQFMSGKEQTQEGFFHTFNDLHNSGHQIVITSDRPPKALALLEDRLRSRFEWGLIADIQPPDLETRMAILSAKAEDLHVELDESIIELIAKRVQKNVRELEGSLNRVVAYSKMMNVPITLDSTSGMLDDLTADTARHAIDPERIIEEVSHHFKVTDHELLGKGRTKKVAQARQVVMYLLMYELEMSPTQVGRLLGGRDHATVIHGAGKINGEINEDNQLRQDVLTIKEAIFT